MIKHHRDLCVFFIFTIFFYFFQKSLCARQLQPVQFRIRTAYKADMAVHILLPKLFVQYLLKTICPGISHEDDPFVILRIMKAAPDQIRFLIPPESHCIEMHGPTDCDHLSGFIPWRGLLTCSGGPSKECRILFIGHHRQFQFSAWNPYDLVDISVIPVQDQFGIVLLFYHCIKRYISSYKIFFSRLISCLRSSFFQRPSLCLISCWDLRHFGNRDHGTKFLFLSQFFIYSRGDSSA